MNQEKSSQRKRSLPGRRLGKSVPPVGSEGWEHPWVQLKYFSYHPCIYPAMIRSVSADAAAGDLVQVYDRNGERFGTGVFNPGARVPLRIYHHGGERFAEEAFLELIERAMAWRLDALNLPEATDAFRVVHSDGDGLGGLVVDRYADVLSVEVYNLGIQRRLSQWLPALHRRLGTSRELIRVDPTVARLERMPVLPVESEVRSVRIRENGVRYEVNFATGHKTGFFCDQRENRRRLASRVADKRVLDLCCYTGGFALSAAVAGQAGEVTGVDLDEQAIAQARRNANLNQVRVDWVHCDAFSYARQMQRNGDVWEVVVVDPPKFILDRQEMNEGRQKYEDLNGLAISLVKTGGLLVTCSCSGLLSAPEFEQILVRSAHRLGRRLQFVQRTAAGPDHPVMSNCAESSYLKVVWARVW